MTICKVSRCSPPVVTAGWPIDESVATAIRATSWVKSLPAASSPWKPFKRRQAIGPRVVNASCRMRSRKRCERIARRYWMVERVGFEPANPVRGLRFSSLPTRAITQRSRTYVHFWRPVFRVLLGRKRRQTHSPCDSRASWKRLRIAQFRRSGAVRGTVPIESLLAMNNQGQANRYREPYRLGLQVRRRRLVFMYIRIFNIGANHLRLRRRESAIWRCAVCPSTSR